MSISRQESVFNSPSSNFDAAAFTAVGHSRRRKVPPALALQHTSGCLHYRRHLRPRRLGIIPLLNELPCEKIVGLSPRAAPSTPTLLITRVMFGVVLGPTLGGICGTSGPRTSPKRPGPKARAFWGQFLVRLYHTCHQNRPPNHPKY